MNESLFNTKIGTSMISVRRKQEKRLNKEEANKKKKIRKFRLWPDSCFLLGVLYCTRIYRNIKFLLFCLDPIGVKLITKGIGMLTGNRKHRIQTCSIFVFLCLNLGVQI